jgi:hypothetical protein
VHLFQPGDLILKVLPTVALLVVLGCMGAPESTRGSTPDARELQSELENPSAAIRHRAINIAKQRPANRSLIRSVISSFRFNTVYSLHGRATLPNDQTQYLGSHPGLSAPLLMHALTDTDVNVRRYSALCLGLTGRQEAIPALSHGLSVEIQRDVSAATSGEGLNQAVVRTFVFALGLLSPQQAMDKVIYELGLSTGLNRRLVVIDALAQLIDPEKVSVACNISLVHDCAIVWRTWWRIHRADATEAIFRDDLVPRKGPYRE